MSERASISEKDIVSPSINIDNAFPIPNNGSPTHVKIRSLTGSSPSASQSHRMADAFPTISYSSSEDEDEVEFFDANEFDNEHGRLVWNVKYIKLLNTKILNY